MLSDFTVFGVRGIHANVPFERTGVPLREAKNWARRIGNPEVFISEPERYNEGYKIFAERFDRMKKKGYASKAEGIRLDLFECDQIFFKECLCY